MSRQVITVSGIDGSGKSIFALRLAEHYHREGLGAVVLHVDDFRRRVDWQRSGRSQAAIYGEEYFDLAGVERCLAAFRGGAPSCARTVFDPRREEVAGELTIPLAGLDVVIVEGVFMMRLPSTAEHFRVWIEASYAVGKQRIVERAEPPWRSREEWEYRIDNRYFPAQRAFAAAFRPMEAADVVIDNEDWRAPRLVRADLSRLSPPLRPGLQGLLPRSA